MAVVLYAVMLVLGLFLIIIIFTIELVINLPDLIRQIGDHVKRFVFFLK